MIAFAGMLVHSAEEGGIRVPEDLENYDPAQFPHWDVYCKVQLGARMPSPTSHCNNAKVVGAISNDKIRHVTLADLIAAGLDI